MKSITTLWCILGLVCMLQAQNVGIGIANPQDQLHVQNALRIEGSFPTLKFYQGITYAASMEQNGSNTIFSNRKIGKLIFNSNLINRLMIIENGFIGIDNSAPLDRLHIKNGSMRIEHTTAPKLKLFQGSTFASSFEQNGDNTAIKNLETGNLSLYTDAQERMTIDSIGNVGLNINTPQDLLHLKDGHLRIQHSSIPQFKMYRAGTFSASIEQNGSNTFFRNREAGSLTLFTNNLPRASINSAGLMGIGTTTPADMLHLKGGAARIETTSNPELKLYQGTSHMASFAQNAFNTRIQNFTAGNIALFTLGLERLTVKSTGETGIGTNNPLDKLHIKNGALRIENSFPAINLYQSAALASKIEHNGNNLLIRNLEAGSMSLHTSNQPRMVLTSTGDAGVGTTTPSQKLDVEGKIEIGNDNAPATEGAMRYNSDRKDMEFYNGSKWISISRGETFHTPNGLDDSFSDFEGLFPNVCMDDNGTIIIVWAAHGNIYKSEYRNDSWIHPADTADHINPTSDPSINRPEVVCDQNNDAVITWLQKPVGSSQRHLYMSEYRSSAWTHPANTNDYISITGSSVSRQQSAVSNSGEAVICWIQPKGGVSQIYMSEYRSGVWTHPANFSDNISIDGGNVETVEVAVGNTASIVAWSQFDAALDINIYMSEYRGGSWNHPLSLNDHISPNMSLVASTLTGTVDVAIDNTGTTIICWIGERVGIPDPRHIYISEYRSGIWSHPVSQHDILKNLAVSSTSHFVKTGINDQGLGIVVYAQEGDLKKIEYLSGIWKSTEDFNSFIGIASNILWLDFDIAVNDNNSVFVGWNSPQTGLYQSLLKGQSWSYPANPLDRVNPNQVALSFDNNPRVAMNNSDQAILVWSQLNNQGESRIYISQY